MTASDHLKHRTGSLGGDQDEKAVEQIIAQASDFSNVPHDALLVAHADLFNYARELEASLAQKTRECEEAKAGEALQASLLWSAYQEKADKKFTFSGWLGWLVTENERLLAQVEQLQRQVADNITLDK